MKTSKSMLEYAIEYINKGLAVFPLYPKDKRPMTERGCLDATLDPKQAEAWWTKEPRANIGIATGGKSGGLLVVDLDIDEDTGKNGYEELKKWQKENGSIGDETWTSITGRGGYHLFYKSDKEHRNRGGILEGIDIRGEGGYIVAPPSLHPNGKRYEWEYEPGDYALMKASETLYKFLSIGTEDKPIPFMIPKKIGDGKRNITLFKLAASQQGKGLSDESIWQVLITENQLRCSPPLSEKELTVIFNSVIEKYKKGTPRKATQTNDPNERWRYSLRLNEKFNIKQTIPNVCIILENDTNLKGKLFYNTFSYAPWIKGVLPWDNRENDREWTNTDDSNLKCYMEDKYDLSNSEKILEGLTIVTNKNKFNPVVDFLEGLEWDGESHIENLLPDFLGVEKSEYSIECMRIFMLGAIARAYYPGTKFDYMIVLTGKQGVGKSTFFRLLACGTDWYSDNFNTVEGDKAAEKLRGMWIVELAELLAVKRAQAVESMKAFITSTADTYRAPYARRTECRPRQCVFAGTTNNNHFLTDKTGNRRYLPLAVNKEKVKKSLFDGTAEAEFKQAWAEALVIFKKGEYSLVLPYHLQDQAEQAQEAYVEEDSRVGIIQEWLDNLTADKSLVCVAMIYEQALENDYVKPDKKTSNEIHDIMQHCITGWKRVENKNNGRRRCGGYGSQICYERIENEEFQKVNEEQMKIPF